MQRKIKALHDRRFRLSLSKRLKNQKNLLLYVTFSKHNAHLVATDATGNIFMRDSCGTLGFLKSSRNTYLAFFELGERMAWQLFRMGARALRIFVRGTHRYRRAVLYGVCLRRTIKILSVRDISPISHNGCRLSNHRYLRRRRRARVAGKIQYFLKRLLRRQRH